MDFMRTLSIVPDMAFKKQLSRAATSTVKVTPFEDVSFFKFTSRSHIITRITPMAFANVKLSPRTKTPSIVENTIRDKSIIP